MVKTVADLPKRISEAFEIGRNLGDSYIGTYAYSFLATSGRPGPVVVDLPFVLSPRRMMKVANPLAAVRTCKLPY